MKITYKEKKFKSPRKAEIKNIFMKHQDSQLQQGRDGSYNSIINDNYYWINLFFIFNIKYEPVYRYKQTNKQRLIKKILITFIYKKILIIIF